MTDFPGGDIITTVKEFKKADALAARTAKAAAKATTREALDAKMKALAAEAKAAGLPIRVLGPRPAKATAPAGVTA